MAEHPAYYARLNKRHGTRVWVVFTPTRCKESWIGESMKNFRIRWRDLFGETLPERLQFQGILTPAELAVAVARVQHTNTGEVN